MPPEQQAHFRLLKTLEQYPEYSQRELAEAIGLSLGRTNYVIHALMELGFLKVDKFHKADHKPGKTAYVLTPAGIRHRLELTQGYIEHKQAEYDALKVELEGLCQKVSLNSKGKKQGMQQGETAVLERLITKRFGPLNDAIRTRMNSATLEQLDRWADRILDASSLEQLFQDS